MTTMMTLARETNKDSDVPCGGHELRDERKRRRHAVRLGDGGESVADERHDALEHDAGRDRREHAQRVNGVARDDGLLREDGVARHRDETLDDASDARVWRAASQTRRRRRVVDARPQSIDDEQTTTRS